MRKKLSIISVATLLVCLSFFVVKEVAAKTLTIGTATDNILIPGELCFGVDTNCKASWSEIIEAGSQWLKNGTSLYYNNGNVGIGTTGSNSRLKVYGSGSAPTTTTSNSQFVIAGSNNRIEFGTPDVSNARYAWILARHDMVETYGGYYSTLHLQPDISGTENDYEGVAIGYDPTIKLGATTGLAVAGSVGINDTNPTNKLSVVGDIAGTGLKITTPAGGYSFVTGGTNFTIGNGGGGGSKLSVLGNTAIGSTYYGYAAPTDGLIVQGNVGIGVAAPVGQLEIATSSSVVLNNSSLVNNYNLNLFQTNISSGEGAGLAFTVFGGGNLGNSYTPGAAITFERVGNNSQGGLHFKVKGTTGATDALTDALSIKYDGNVGIGTTNPIAKLQVEGTILGTTLSTHWHPSIDHSILYNATVRYTVTQSGPTSFDLPSLFDGVFNPSYTAAAPSDVNPQIITISNLPNVHTQTAAYVGWTTRYWAPLRFKIEGYDTYAGANVWRTIADYSGSDYGGGQEFFTAVPYMGTYSQLRFTIYTCSGNSGACGLSELFFIHPEGGRPYIGIIPSSMWEGASGNVGIGTTAPSQKLDVAGYTKATGFCIGASCITAWPSLTEADAVIGNEVTNVTNSTLTRSGSGTAASPYTLALNLANANTWTGAQTMSANTNFPGSGIWNTSGYVGIGTTNPGGYDSWANKLVIASASGPTGLSIITDSSSSGNIFFGDGTGSTDSMGRITYSNSADEMQFWTVNSQRAVINNLGNVGIGKTNPATTLDVNGAITAVGLCFGTDCKANWDAVGSFWAGTSGGNIWNTNSGNVGIGTNNPLADLHIFGGAVAGTAPNLLRLTNTGTTDGSGTSIYMGYNNNLTDPYGIRLVQKGNPGGYRSGTFDIQRHNTTAGDADANWLSSLFIDRTGNVGIGDTAPSYKLTVLGDIYGTGALMITNSSANNWISGKLGIGNATQGGSKLSINGNASIGAGYFSSAAPASGLIVEGNVGIGTSSPGVYKLNVDNGAVTQYAINLVSSNKFLRMGALNSSWAHIDTDATDGVYFYDSVELGAGNSHFNISSGDSWIARGGGNVGIGTSAPSYKLHVAGDVYATGWLRTAGDVGWYSQTYGGGWRMTDSSWIRNYNNKPLYITGDGTRSAYFNGSVGIGTTNPGSKLDVQTAGYGWPATSGTSQTYGGLRISPPSASGSVVLDAGVNTSNGAWLQATNRTDLSIEYPLILNPNGGNVGIGTTAPSQKLDVAGYTKATGFCIGASCITAWPSLTEADAIIGNEVTNVTNSTLTRSGSGTAASPYTLALNLANANTWTGAQTMSANTNFPGSGIWNTSGNVGIGTASPGSGIKLDVNGAIRSNSIMSGSVFVDNDNSAYFLNPDGSISLIVAGSVGIGTTNPGTYKLNVVGNTYLNGTATVTGGITSGLINGQTISSAANFTGTMAVSGNVGIGVASPAQKLHVVGTSYFNGNVGIGATTPGAKLHVANTGANNAAIFVNTSATQAVGNTAELVFGVGSGFVYTNGPRVYAYQEATSGSVTGLRFDTYNSGRATRMTIKGDGKVGIGLTTPSEALEVNGNIKATQYIYNSSDRALKTNIATINNPLDKIMKLRGVTFDWKKDGSSSVGLIAQEVAKVYPELVTGEEGNKSVAYSNLVAPLIEAVKAQQKEIQTLNARINKLELELYKR